MKYDPARHHRGSIRLKGHDYAGDGMYFVTLCAHRELAAAEVRNRFVIEHADSLFTPYITQGGMLDRLLKELSKANIL
jgi:hypothetical protein